MVDSNSLLGAALSMRVTADTSGLEADLASKLTGAERVAIQSAERVSGATGQLSASTARSVEASSQKVTVAQLRVVSAQERYNKLLQDETATQGQRASAQASLITAQERAKKEQYELNEAQEKGREASQRLNIAMTAVGVAAAAFAVKSAGAFKELGGEVKGLSRLTGDTVEQSSELRFAAHETGIEYASLTTGIRTLEKHLVANDDAAKALGITYRDASGNLLPFHTTLDAIANRFADMPDGAEKTALAIQLFGRSGATLIPFLNKGSSGLAEMADEAERLGLVLDESAIATVSDATKATRDWESALQAVEVAIGEKTLPVLTTLKEIGAGGLRFVAEHRSLAATAGGATVAAAAFGKLGGAATNFNEIISAGATLLSRFRTGSAVAQNAALATSYRAVATAAGAAAVAEEGAAVAAGGAGLTGAGIGAASIGGTSLSRIGVLGRTGTIARTALLAGGAAIADPLLLPLLFGGDDQHPDTNTARQTQFDLLGKFRYSGGKFYLDGREVTDPRAIAVLSSNAQARVPGATSNLTSTSSLASRFPGMFGYDGSSPDAEAAAVVLQNKALQGVFVEGATVSAARQQVKQGGLSYASGVDLFSNAPQFRSGRTDALETLSRARASQTTAQNQAELAERRLNQLRRSGEATALQLASAEESLRTAKQRSADASRDVKDAEKAVDDTRLPTAKDLLSTTKSQRHRADRDAKAVAKLYAAGLSPALVAEIVEKNSSTPGALESVARTMTPKLAAALQRQFRHLKFDGSVIMGSPKDWEKAGNDRALDFIAGVEATFNTANIPVPVVKQHRRLGRQGRSGAYRTDANDTPSTGRRRQRSLSGADTPFGP